MAAVTKIVSANVAKETKLLTHESRLNGEAAGHFAEHSTAKHSAGEYVRGEVHVNKVEGDFSIFMRGMKGVFQHRAAKHPHGYVAEYDFRYNHSAGLAISDMGPMFSAVRSAEGKRFTYNQAH